MARLLYGMLAGVALIVGTASAQQNPSCTCTCFDGRPLAVCSDSTQEGFLCTPSVCPPKPPVTPIPQQQTPLPNPTDQVCKLVLGVNPANGQNEFRTVCK